MRDDWELENHPYSPAGEVEGIGRFAVGANRRRSRRGRQGSLARVVAIVVLLALIVPVVLGMVASLVG